MRRSDHIPLPSRPCPSTAVFYILSSSEYPFRALDVVTCRTVGLNKHFMNDIPALDIACTSLLHVVAVALVDADGRVFLQQRPPENPMAGLWEFPGGTMEAGETTEAAMVRELKEEVGIETTLNCLYPTDFPSARRDDHHMVFVII